MEIWIFGKERGGILELRIWTKEKKLEIWIFRMGGGVFWNFGFGLRKRSWKFGFLGWGVFWNFGFGLREKSWKFGFLGWGGILELRIWT